LEEVTKFEAAHVPGSTARLALALLLFTGQRKFDVIAFGRQHVKDGWLCRNCKPRSMSGRAAT
jgi:hypothetical protein